MGVDILSAVRTRGAYADQLLKSTFESEAILPADKALLVELVHGTLRWRGQLDWVLAELYHRNFRKVSTILKSILEISLYQIRFLEKVPHYAAVSEGVRLAKQLGGPEWGKLVNGILRNYLRRESSIKLPEVRHDPVAAISVRHSHPDWIVRRWLQRYGESDTVRYCTYNNQRPCLSARVNLTKTSSEELIAQLQELEVTARRSEYFSDYLVLSGLVNPADNLLFQDGFFTIQDQSTALASLLLEPEPGDRILDLCAAPGGKTCHLAHLTQDRAEILAVDVNKDRLAQIGESAKRLGLSSIKVKLTDARSLSGSTFDKILLDAPCTGLGVLSRRSDLRWCKQPADLKKIVAIQIALLQNAARLLTPGGKLVYSTCSLEPEETEELLDRFLQQNEGFALAGTDVLPLQKFASRDGFFRSLPHVHGTDGAFAAALVRTA